ncbi:Protein OS-9 [Mortierella sp. AD011]|nr:Protein OS-9 [Mortierella sp. AD010]KAF9397102.1 Protein OS-9 [Mortierella sp. AD011]
MRLTTISLSKASILAFATLASVSFLDPIAATSYGFVYNDLLAHPQYHVQCLDDLVSVSDIGPDRIRQGNLHHQKPTVQIAPQIGTAKQDQNQKSPSQDHGQDQLRSNGQSPSESALDLSSSMIMTDADGQKWACAIPLTQVPVNKPEPEKTPEEMKAETERSIKRGLELLDHLTGRCLLTNRGYWTYEYCHKKRIRQFNAHIVNGKWEPTSEAATHTLATYQPPPSEVQTNANTDGLSKNQASSSSPSTKHPTTTELRVSSERKYLVQHWDYGSVCDLTGAYRKVEVQFQCANVDDRIQLITESPICAYTMVIYSSSLCKDAAFETEANKIDCRRIVSDDYYRQRKAAIESGIDSTASQDSNKQIRFDQQPYKDESKAHLPKEAGAFKEMASLIDKVEAATRRKQLDDLAIQLEAYLERLKPYMSKDQLEALRKMEDFASRQDTQHADLESLLQSFFGGETGLNDEIVKDNSPMASEAEQLNVKDKRAINSRGDNQDVFQLIFDAFDETYGNAASEPGDEDGRNKDEHVSHDDLLSSINLASLLEMLDATKKNDDAHTGDDRGTGNQQGQDDAKKSEEDAE